MPHQALQFLKRRLLLLGVNIVHARQPQGGYLIFHRDIAREIPEIRLNRHVHKAVAKDAVQNRVQAVMRHQTVGDFVARENMHGLVVQKFPVRAECPGIGPIGKAAHSVFQKAQIDRKRASGKV